MAKPNLLIAESQNFSGSALSALERYFDVELADLDRSGLLQRVPHCDYLWIRLRTMIDREIIDASPRLKAIVTNTTGLNHIDVDHARSRAVQVLSLQGETEFLQSIRATAEHTIGLTLALLRAIPAAHRHVCAGNWDRSEFLGREIFRRSVGIIGHGRLGKIVAGYFQALGADVAVHDRKLEPGTTVDGIRSVALGEVLMESDIVSLHVAFEPENRQMIGKQQFRSMKVGSVFINTSRGELVDEFALAEALESGHLAGAALDVVDAEHAPTPSRERLIQFARNSNRLILTPHIGGNTIESTERTELFLAEKLCRSIGAPTSHLAIG